jgi:diaminopimelate epimerase
MRLSKHHGLGNDFLVLVDVAGAHPVNGNVAAAVCDRHRGVGADGLIRVTRWNAGGFRMELFNEDGSTAEISGNGICCLAQALVRHGAASGPTVDVHTEAGARTVEIVERRSPIEHRMRVSMGEPVVGDVPVDHGTGTVLDAVHVDVGNPHIVFHVPDPAHRPDLVELGAKVNASVPGGTNVELVTGGGGELDMTVYERGVGPTLACGSGAVAAAAAAERWGLVGKTVTVNQPGGPAVVELGPPALLTVPVVAVASIEWPL